MTVAARSTSESGTIRVYSAVGGKKKGDPVATFTVEAERAAVDLRRPGAERGHLETYGYVALEAEHFAENVAGADGSRWAPVQGVGQRVASMGAFPETAPRVDSGFDTTAQLRYRVHFATSGEFTGTFYRLPTLNEGTEDDGTGDGARRTARTAIGLDDQVPTEAQLVRGNSVAGTSTSPWGFNIMQGIEPLEFTVDVAEPGWHDLVVYRSDAAILFDRIVVETRPGAAGDGLVGPPESPNNVAPRDTPHALPHGISHGISHDRAVVAPLPKEMPELRRLPDVDLAVGSTTVLDGVRDAASAASDNETAVSVAVAGGKVSVTGNRVGRAELTITGSDGADWVASVAVGPGAGEPAGAYLERAGLVVLDAADALEGSDFADATASNNGTHDWALARNGLQVVPPANSSAKAQWLATSAAQAEALFGAGPTEKVNGGTAAGTPPQLDFTVDVETGGTYYLFANTSSPNPDADSYHVLVDGRWRYHSGKTSPETGTDTWYGSTSAAGAALQLEPGRHTISLAPREAGLVLNQVALTTDSSPGFQGFLEPSERSAP